MVYNRDWLIKYLNDKEFTSYAEIGVWRAKLARRVWTECPKLEQIFLIDPYDVNKMNRFVDGKWHVNSSEAKGRKRKLESQETMDEAYANLMAEKPFHVEVIRATSAEAADQFEDNSLDMAFIDADHFYEGVKLDILMWLPKVRRALLGDDYIKRFPGVCQAVKEVFGENYSTSGQIWYHEKTLESTR